MTDELLAIPEFPSTVSGILWDLWHMDRNIFIAFNNEKILTYVHIRDSIKGKMFRFNILLKVTSLTILLNLDLQCIFLISSSEK